MIGRTIRRTIRIPSTPHEPFIIPMLEDTVLNDSFTDAPTRGTKLLIANLAVLSESVSAPCAKTFLSEKTKVKIDIIKTVTEVKVVRVTLEIAPNSYPPIDFIQENIIESFINGNISLTRQVFITAIKIIIEVFSSIALEIFPLIISTVVIIGTNAFIDSQSVPR